jgi:general secretion pathway protein B
MSFILDALRKSEIERQRQSGPSMVEFPVAREDRRLPVALIAIGVLLAVNVGVLLFFLLRDQAAPAAAATQVAIAAPASMTSAPPPVASAAAPAPASSATPLPETPGALSPLQSEAEATTIIRSRPRRSMALRPRFRPTHRTRRCCRMRPPPRIRA